MYEELVSMLRKKYNLAPMVMEAADAIVALSDTLKAYQDTTDMVVEEAPGKMAIRFESKWIPVEKRLPEKRKWVLCRCEANIIEVLRWENNEWYHDPMHVYFPSFVTHWMPLPPFPEPPKEEA